MSNNGTLPGPHARNSGAGRSRASHWFLLIAAGFAWGATFSLAKIATQGDVHPLALTLWQTFFGCIALLLYTAVRRRTLPLTKPHLQFYLVAGILGTAIPGVLYFVAARQLPAGVLAITIATVPMLTLVISRALGSEVLTLARAVGITMGALGILLILVPDTSLPDASAAPFVGLAILCALCYSIENVYIDFRMPPGEALTILCGMLAVATILLAPVTVFLGAFWWPQWPLAAIEWSIIGLALLNAFAYGTFVHLVNAAGPVFASQTAYIVTLSGVAWGMLLFGESHSFWVIAATASMMVGLLLVRPRT